jgi:hypothetical protein
LALKEKYILGSVTLPPIRKKDISELAFSELESEIQYFKSKGEILRCGDLNTRTGGMLDFLPLDNIKQTFTDNPLPPTYIPDSQICRKQVDTKCTLLGSLLIDICKNHHLRILNGRFLGNYYTFFNSNGKSTIDYMLSTIDL